MDLYNQWQFKEHTVPFFLGDFPNICGLYYKQVMIVIYDRNDSGLYYKTRDNRN